MRRVHTHDGGDEEVYYEDDDEDGVYQYDEDDDVHDNGVKLTMMD